MPMGKYASFDACVKANQDKGNPRAYCGSIYWKTEGKGKRKAKSTKGAFVRASKKS